MKKKISFKLITIISGVAFFALSSQIATLDDEPSTTKNTTIIVIPPALQTIIFGGDRFLASNIEAIRASVTNIDKFDPSNETDRQRLFDRARLHDSASRLNPCHEENYNLANAVLTWGGLQDQGNTILLRASNCRFWDEFAPFYYGINQYFSHKNLEKATQYVQLAAERSTKNRTAFNKIVIALRASRISDTSLAISYLKQEQQNTQDTKLKTILDKRIKRLEGLKLLQDASIEYQQKTGRPLQKPDELIQAKIIEVFPQDPTRLGYTFDNGQFGLRKLNVGRN